MSQSYLNWNPEDDETIRDGSVDRQTSLHRRKYKPQLETPEKAEKWMQSDRTAWRKQSMEKAEKVMQQSFHGRLLEIGAGTGWCSGYLSNKENVDEVYALEYDPYCVKELMPLVHDNIDADKEKISYVLGSFNNIPKTEWFDSIISIGGIHHSEDLQRTLNECYKALKPGGWFVASEPAESDRMTESIRLAKRESIDEQSKEKYGEENVKHKENSDHYVRISKYIAKSYQAGFTVYPFLFDQETGAKADNTIFTDIRCWDKYTVATHQPFYAQTVYDNLLLILHKPNTKQPDFEELEEYENNVPQNPAPPILSSLQQKLRKKTLSWWERFNTSSSE